MERFAVKLDAYKQDVETSTFYCFKHLKKFLLVGQVNMVKIECTYNLMSQFCNKFQDFQCYGAIFPF